MIYTYVLIAIYVTVTPGLSGYANSPEVRNRTPVRLGEFVGLPACQAAAIEVSRHLTPGSYAACVAKTEVPK